MAHNPVSRNNSKKVKQCAKISRSKYRYTQYRFSGIGCYSCNRLNLVLSAIQEKNKKDSPRVKLKINVHRIKLNTKYSSVESDVTDATVKTWFLSEH